MSLYSATFNKSPQINLGKNLTEFPHEIKIESQGGSDGEVTWVKEPARALLTAKVNGVGGEKPGEK